ncbi:ABC transporter substrate-binding protein [Chromobacterium sp. ATCC 53434]|uniref:ABC transporter substrate-binding protein n=1 Tax=Chromobacterium sp. (strain ATCC 53434 / SC 14030) TaxID=2059672 RepID=UPI00130540F9|nr:ABC transporter substrate binding protein [Chromobacterium sp. ATCC 53434]
MIKRLLLAAKFAFALGFAALVVAHKLHSARILIIHSYDADYSWVKEENEGLNRFFDRHPEVSLRWHYLDLKRHQDDDFRRAAAAGAVNAIARWKPDVIILLDDIAQQLVGTRYRGDARLKIVFAGVNSRPQAYGYDKADNVTGILERKPLRAVDDTLRTLWGDIGGGPDKPRSLLIGDKSFDFAAGLFEYRDYLDKWRYIRWVPPLSADTFDDWKTLVLRAPAVADFILVSDYRQLRREPGAKAFVPAAEVMGWTERNAKIPVLGLSTAATQDGAMMAVATAGYEQGWEAARMAYALTRGTPIARLPVMAGKESMVSIRQSALRRRGFEMPFIYEAFARAKDLQFD